MMLRAEHCPSDLSLDRWLAGELTGDDATTLAAHVESCAFCEHRRAARLEAQRRFAREAPPFAAVAAAARSGSSARSGLSARSGPSGPRGRASHRAWLAGGCGLAAAALLALAIGEPWRAVPRDEGFGTRTKGGPASLGWVVRRGERVFTGHPEQRLRPGDIVRFTVNAREPVFVAVLGLDASGKPSVYHPEGPELARLEAGSGQLLPAAIELDAAPGGERLYAVFCTSALPVERVLEAVERAPAAPALPPGCGVELHTLQQEPP